MWIESHETLRGHPKLKKAARLANVSRVSMVGHLHFLWWWAMNYAPTGDLGGYDKFDIADAAGWEEEPDILINALISCGRNGESGFLFINDNGELEIHDWHDYAGKLIDKRRSDAERKRNSRAKVTKGNAAKRPADVQRTGDRRPLSGAGTEPNQPNQPNQTEPTGESASWDIGTLSRYWTQKTTRPITGGAGGERDLLMMFLDDWKDLVSWEEVRSAVDVGAAAKGAACKPAYVGGILRNQKNGTHGGQTNTGAALYQPDQEFLQ